MSGLPIERILWAGNRNDHDDHLHVEGSPSSTGTPPLTRPPMTPSLIRIYDALTQEFGAPYYFTSRPPPLPNWSHMGWYNRRPIRTNAAVWSQHAYSNALDIGPYYGKASQQRFYDFLTNYDDSQGDDMFTKGYNEADWKKLFNAGVVAGNSWAEFRQYWVVEAADRTDSEHLQASGNIVIALATRGSFFRR